mmetsp:Transcript_12406/g.21200  ORF Transcript_12406/g.21200 Transcript_12406/m.21200 type:complete len:131 (-) Transcript_12406:52-444(-)
MGRPVEFTPAEDEKIIKFVRSNGQNRFKELAHMMPGRDPYQLRLRYLDYLQYSEHELERPYTQEEDEVIWNTGIHREGSYLAPSTFSHLSNAFRKRPRDILNRFYVLAEMKGQPIRYEISLQADPFELFD